MGNGFQKLAMDLSAKGGHTSRQGKNITTRRSLKKNTKI